MLSPAFALLAWPLVAFFLFRRLRIELAVIWSVFLSFLFLPSSFEIDLPALPPLDKESLPNLVLFLLVASKVPLRLRTMPRALAMLSVAMAVGVVGTVMTNGEPVWTADGAMPGLGLYDVFSSLVRKGLVIMPFFVGWRILGSVGAQREILRVIVILGLGYSLLMLAEVRLSPQLHTWVYGYFPHSFAQQIRADGYRPVVFFRHGLWNSFFAMTTVLAAVALFRDAAGRRGRRMLAARPVLFAVAGYMFVVVVLCKSLGSLLQSMLVVPMILLLSRSAVLWIALAMGILSMSYPVLRGAGLVPADELVQFASSISEDRAGSLEFRFVNEDILLDQATQKPLFGWGGWGRNRVISEESGEDISVVDGYWVMLIGGGGWFGFLTTFGLLFLPLAQFGARSAARARQVSWVTVGLVLFVGVNMLELLPNSTLPPWTWLIAGSLLGSLQQRSSRVRGSGALQER